MNREVIFARTLEDVKKKAKEQGNCISRKQLEEAFAELGLETDQLALVEDYLEKHKIGIGEPVKPEDYLTGEEIRYLDNYLEEIKGLEEVTEGEREAITLSAMAGDKQAQARLAEIYLPEVVQIAKLYGGQGVYLEDLIGEGNVAVAAGVTMLGHLVHLIRYFLVGAGFRQAVAYMLLHGVHNHFPQHPPGFPRLPGTSGGSQAA